MSARGIGRLCVCWRQRQATFLRYLPDSEGDPFPPTPTQDPSSLSDTFLRYSYMKVVLTFELLELDLPAQTLPNSKQISLFAPVFQFSFSYFKLHPLKLFGAKPFPRPILLWGHEEQGQPASATLNLTLAGRHDSSPWGLSPLPPTHRNCFPHGGNWTEKK